MIPIGPTVTTTPKSKSAKTLKAAHTSTSHSEISKKLPKRAQQLVTERRCKDDRRRKNELRTSGLDLRSGADRRRGASQGHVDLSV
ncbi:MAG: hypothetical protein CL693_09615 [Cellvibrionaceae bacterium]|nr:hypothetical protein [Cellvibrionaceae bacterium]